MRKVLRLVPRRRAALAVVLGALTVLSGAALLAVSGALITRASQRPETMLVLMPLITSVRLFGVSRAALRYAERLVSHDLTLRLVGRLRADLLARLVPLAPAALTGARSGDLLARIRSDVDELQGVFVRLLAPTGVAVLASAVAVALTALVHAGLALVLAGLLLGLGVLVPAAVRHAGRNASVDVAQADAAFGSDTLDLVRGLADHLTGDGGEGALRRLDASLARQEAAERTNARLAGTTTALREGVPVLGLLAALWLVGSGVASGSTSPALLAASALGVLGAFEAVGGLGAAWGASEGLAAAGRRVRALGEQSPAVQEPPEPLPRPSSAALSFEGVTLTYPGAARPALVALDLHVQDGEKVALTGPSGAGKSSVLALALRVRDPDAGRVALSDTDLRELALADVRSRSAWAPQSPQVLGGSLAANLLLGRHDASEDDLVEMLHTVGLEDVLERVGLHGWVGESGERLSAGERARIGLARALLSEADVLLLDEPTAHLDAPLATRLLTLLASQERTVLLVTHRPDELDASWRRVELDAPVRQEDGAPEPLVALAAP